MTADPIPSEVEVKLEAAAPDALRQIARLRALGRYRLRPRRVQALQTTYYDTADRALVRAGIALRVRRAGSRWEATAKWPGAVVKALHTRPELTVALPGAPATPFVLPDGPLREALEVYVLGRALLPLLCTDIERRLLDLLPGDGPGAPLAELALDTVTLRHPDGAAAATPFWEVEIEQRAGTSADCLAAARTLRRQFSLVPSRATKFARGLAALADGRHPVTPLPTTIAAGDTLRAATRGLIGAQLARIRAVVPAVRRGGRDPEPVHQMRVAVRRLRTALRLGRDALPARQAERLTCELRWLAGELGALRDLDVQLANLEWHRRRLGAAARGHLDGYRRALLRQRTVARRATRTLLDGERFAALLLALEHTAGAAARPAAGPAATPITRAGRQAVKRAWRRLVKRGAALDELPEAEDLHALRIRGKRLRYVLEALEPITGRAGRRVIAQLTELQDVLGRFNDAIVAAGTVRRYLEQLPADADPAARRALGALADAELRRAGAAQAEFHRAWKRFDAKRTTRRLDALLDALHAPDA